MVPRRFRSLRKRAPSGPGPRARTQDCGGAVLVQVAV